MGFGMQLRFDLDEFVVFDLETTGLSPWAGDEIIELGAIKIFGNELDEKNIFHRLINPKRHISDDASRINGITNDMVKDAPTISEVLPEFLKFVGRARLVAQNARFDMSFMMKSFVQHKIKRDFDVYDTMIFSKRAFPEANRHNLDVISERLGLKVNTSERHRSMEDVRLTAHAFLLMKEMLKDKSPQPEKWSC